MEALLNIGCCFIVIVDFPSFEDDLQLVCTPRHTGFLGSQIGM